MTENGRSALISVAAWAFILLGGYHAVSAAFDLFTVTAMFSSTGIQLGLAGATLPVALPLLARLAAEHVRLVFLAYFILSSTVCATGFGLLLRKTWALASARGLFYLGAAGSFAILLVPGVLVPQPLIRDGVSLAPEFNDAVRAMRTQAQIAAALLCGVFFLAARRCAGAKIKSEFEKR